MTAMLKVDAVCKRFGANVAVDDVSIQLQEGVCGALLGPNGAGKTTLLKMVAGLMKSQSGKITIAGLSSEHDYRHLLGYLPQYPAFYAWMTGREVLVHLGRLAHMSKKKASERAEDILKQVGLEDAADRRVGGYSGGMKQRLGIAQAIIHKPKFVMMDEPVSALDPVGRREILNLLKELKNECTLLFSTHILHDVEELSDHIFVMNQGRIQVDRSLESWVAEQEEPVFFIQADRNLDRWADKLSDEAAIQHVEKYGNKVKVTASNIAKARTMLLSKIQQDDIPVQQFELQRASLEDLFLREVAK